MSFMIKSDDDIEAEVYKLHRERSVQILQGSEKENLQ